MDELTPSPRASGLDVFLVGGAVRDRLLGRPVQDRDWVVVGASVPDMLHRGFHQVGSDFPVFLDPNTGEEYALARTERKSGEGYLGFSVRTQDVTLEEDLSRRDLTINAMALSQAGELVDPFGGQADLQARTLRHVGPAFEEDPVRILRVLRFQARLGSQWQVGESTWDLLQTMVAHGRADELVSERVWKEVARALLEPHPHLLVQGMQELGLLSRPAFHVYQGAGEPSRVAAVQRAAQEAALLETRFALAFPVEGVHEFPIAIPRDVRKVARLLDEAPVSQGRSPSQWVDLLGSAEVFRSGQAWPHLLQAWSAMGQDLSEASRAAAAARNVDIKAIAASMPPGPAVSAAIRTAREAAVAQALSSAQ